MGINYSKNSIKFKTKYRLGINKDFYTSEESLSTRSRNILAQIGGIDAMLLHYNKYTTFENVQNVGAHTNVQLTLFSDYLINREIKDKIETLEDVSDDNCVVPDMEEGNTSNISNIKCLALNDQYLILKTNLSVRAKNVLDNLEAEYNYILNDESKASFIKIIFLEKYNFGKIRNIGQKTEQEIEQLKNDLQKLLISIPDNETELINSKIKSRILNFFNYKLNVFEIEDLIDSNQYLLKKIISISILNLKLPSRQTEILLFYFFSTDKNNLNYVAEKVNYSDERVRQVLQMFEKIKFPEAVDSILNYFQEEKPADFTIDFYNSNLVYFDVLPSVVYNSETYCPNNAFSIFIYSHLLKNSSLYINNAVFNSGQIRKSFLKIDEIIFISKKFIEESVFFELINWIDTEIYNFETVEFEYDTRVLIQRFYKENNIQINPDIVKDLFAIVEKIKKTDWSDITEKVQKNRKKKNKEDILNIVYDFIKASDESQKTATILEHLKSNYIDLPKTKLLNILNKKKTVFTQLGNGYWTLRGAEGVEDIGGSLRDIVTNKLKNSSAPLHISELLSSISQFRNIDVKSLLSNLHAQENKIFKFFNCGYIGLESKVYEQIWHEIPKLNPRNLNIKSLRKMNLNSKTDIVAYLYNKYGYPPIHIFYLFADKTDLVD